MRGRWMIWPERRFVQAGIVIGWALDLLEKVEDISLVEAIDILQDAGVATFAREVSVPPETCGDAMRKLEFED